MAEKKINTVLYDIDQSSDTTDLQKATARTNIGAQAELTAGENIEIDPDTNTISSTSAPQVQADWDEIDTTSASYIQNKPSTFLNLLTEDADQITSGANLNNYTTPKPYFIPSANDMKEITNTPYEQMSLSNPQKTGQSHLYVFKTKTDNGRITQLLITPYSTDPADDNAFGIWYRTSSENGDQWTDWFRIGDSGANQTITVTSTSVSDGTNTFNQYVHPTTAGNKHIPSGGSNGKILGWQADGTAFWRNPPSLSPAGSTVKPVYIDSNGTPKECDFVVI